MKLFRTKTNKIEKKLSVMTDITIIANHIYKNGNNQYYIDKIYSYIRELKSLGFKATEVKTIVKNALLQSLLSDNDSILILRTYKDLWTI